MTEAQKRANAKYREANHKKMSIDFYSAREQELYLWCKEQGNSKIKALLWEIKSKQETGS